MTTYKSFTFSGNIAESKVRVRGESIRGKIVTLTGGVENSPLRLSLYAGFLTLLYGGALVPCRGFDFCWVLPMSMSSSSVGNSKFVGTWICFLSRDTPPDGRCASITKYL